MNKTSQPQDGVSESPGEMDPNVAKKEKREQKAERIEERMRELGNLEQLRTGDNPDKVAKRIVEEDVEMQQSKMDAVQNRIEQISKVRVAITEYRQDGTPLTHRLYEGAPEEVRKILYGQA